jgi:hypothetical protein
MKQELPMRPRTEVYVTDDNMIAIAQEQMGENQLVYFCAHDVQQIIQWLEKCKDEADETVTQELRSQA